MKISVFGQLFCFFHLVIELFVRFSRETDLKHCVDESCSMYYVTKKAQLSIKRTEPNTLMC